MTDSNTEQVPATWLKVAQWIACGAIIALVLFGGWRQLSDARESARLSEALDKTSLSARAIAKLDFRHGPSSGAPVVEGIHPELSWRVAILPFLDEEELYSAFHMDEPWDSPHNKQLIGWMPKAFQTGLSLERGRTCVVMPVEAQATNSLLARPPKSQEALTNLLDQAVSVGRVVEVPPELAVIWTKPDELSITDPRLVAFRSRLVIAFFDGHTIALAPDEVTPEKLKAMFSPRPADEPAIGDPK